MRHPGGLRLLAWSLGGLGLALPLATGALAWMNRNTVHNLDQAGIGQFIGLGYAVIGAVLASRLRRNPIGWMFLGIALFTGLSGLTEEYAVRDLYVHPLPLADWAAWASNWMGYVVFPGGLALLFFLLFPDGRFASRRWLALGVIGAMWSLALILSSMLQTVDPLSGFPAARLANPVGQAWIGTGPGGNEVTWSAAYIALLGATLVGMAGTVLRYRRSAGVLRQQLKWLAASVLFVAAGLLVAIPLNLDLLWDAVVVLGFGLAVPISCGMAILRHGLYEIDRIVSRTVSYAVVTGLLAAVYVGCVALLTDVLPLRGGVGTAVSVLVAVALFTPLRRRVQGAVDRRFNRARFDAERVVEEFSGRLRDEVDLEVLRADLLRVVDQTVAPAGATLWLREGRSGTR